VQERQSLESWKEIADYLNRSVRTCRRWESDLGLPIHRLDGTPKARVFAYPDEIDRWKEEKLNHAQVEAKKSGVLHGLKNPRVLLTSAGIVAFAVLVIFIWPRIFPGPIPVPSNNPILAILPFENLTGDEVLESWRTAFPDLLVTDLRQSRYVNVIPITLIIDRLEGLKLQDAKKFPAEDLTKIADKLEADFTATGSLLKSGEDIIVNIFVQNSKTREAVKTLRANVRGEQGLLDKADDLSKEIKMALNLTPRQISCDIDEGVHRIATRSPQAFTLYSHAIHMPRWEPFPDMFATLQKAIDLDPKFGLAYRLLYSICDNEHIEDMVRCYQKALALSDRMSERERLYLQVNFYQRYPYNYPKLVEADIPVSTIEKLGPKATGEVLDILERLASLYPDLFGDVSVLRQLSRIYVDTEEWDKAISVLEKGMTTQQRKSTLAPMLIECYRAKGLTDKAEKALDDLSRANPNRNYDSIRQDLALDKRKFDDALGYLKKIYAGPDQKTVPYSYFSQVGYVDWLKDDLESAEEAYRTIVDPNILTEEWQRSTDLAALCLSQGKVGQALEHANKLLLLVNKIKEFSVRGREREIHYMLAYFYRLAGRLPEALKEAEEAGRDYKKPVVPAGLAIRLLHLRALIALEMNRKEEFEGQVGEIKKFSEQERSPRFMRAYYHLLGLRELRQNQGHRAVGYFSRALDLSTPRTRDNDPALCFYSLAEAYELLGDPWRAILNYDEISATAKRGSFSGDIYARSFYRKAKLIEQNWRQFPSPTNGQSRMKAIEYYRKFLSLWGNADPIFSEVEDARSRLAALESK
jgi:tetratricopeptide (TPR) repeat protein